MEYYLKGRALMFIEGLGERRILQGSFTYIPKGAKHGILNVAQPLTIITVYVPPLFRAS
ncbi:MAG: cupin domain-containing protein [Candidatus Bathyarchaeia archaeon]